MNAPALSPSLEDQLIEDVATFYDDPLGFVMFAYPWGEDGPLKDEEGPDEWQIELLNEIGQAVRDGATVDEAIRVAVASGHGIGKVQANELRVPTPSGERSWGEINVGDMLFGADGTPTRVEEKFPHHNWPFYRITFDDGSSTLAGLEHLWNVRGRRERRYNLPGWRTMSTDDIIRAGILRPNGSTNGARQWEIPIQGMVQFDEREIDLHPYVVGVWLGDGLKGEPSYCKPYPEIKRKIESLGYVVNTSAAGMHRLQGVKDLFCDPVFALASCDRYIPEDYKFNTVDNRMALFCGLMDTDGEVYASGSIGYSSTSRRLIDDVIWLARSLGCKAMVHPTVKNGWYPDGNGERIECKDCWRVTINAPFNPFTLEHRKARYKPSEARYLSRWISSIEFSHYGDGHCVLVDADDHLYLTNDFIVTHNTSCIVWIIQWFMSTREFPQVVVTASTQTQLSSKTWRELAKWHRMSIVRHWFNWTATKYHHVEYPDTWFAAAIPWSAQNADAFQGTHEKYVLIIYDEAQAIADTIWDATEGALTTPAALWLTFGNYTKNTGRFHDCFAGRHRNRIKIRKQIDSRTCKQANQAQIKQWVEDYGEDSDFVRIRVRGIAPRTGADQFISQDDVDMCLRYKAEGYEHMPKILVLDVARFGDNKSVASIRQGRKFRVLNKWMELATDQLADRFCELITEHSPDAIVIDGDGIGGAVVDLVRRKRFDRKDNRDILFEFHGAAKPHDPKMWFNRRAEVAGLARKAMKEGIDLPDDKELAAEAVAFEFTYVDKSGHSVIQIESKDDMRARGVASPDTWDTLAMSYSVEVRTMQRKPERKTYTQAGSSASSDAGWMGS